MADNVLDRLQSDVLPPLKDLWELGADRRWEKYMTASDRFSCPYVRAVADRGVVSPPLWALGPH